MPRAKYDFTEVMQQFMEGKVKDRAELVREIMGTMKRMPLPLLKLTQAIADESVRNNFNPVQVIQLGIMYGIVNGILMERERAERMRYLQ